MKSKILFPWKRKTKWSIDLQEHQIRMTLSEIHQYHLTVLHTATIAIDSFTRHNWQEFFMELRGIDQGNAADLSVCLPEVGLLIKPLPEYPYLTKKELGHALGIFQEQVLPWPRKNSLRAIQLLPETDLQRKQENHSCGYLYALELTPYHGFFEQITVFDYVIVGIALRSQLYLDSLKKSITGGDLFLLEFFRERVRCHLFQQGTLTHYRDFPVEKIYREYEIAETICCSLSSYIHYFHPDLDQTTNIHIIGCISEGSLQCSTRAENLFSEMEQKFSNLHFVSLLTYQETSQIIGQFSSREKGITRHEIRI